MDDYYHSKVSVKISFAQIVADFFVYLSAFFLQICPNFQILRRKSGRAVVIEPQPLGVQVACADRF